MAIPDVTERPVSYACKTRECSEETIFEPDMIYWWPGGSKSFAGWYCYDCIDMILQELHSSLIRLDQRVDGRYEWAWANSPLQVLPSALPTPLYGCDGMCEKSYEKEKLEWDADGNGFYCQRCTEEANNGG